MEIEEENIPIEFDVLINILVSQGIYYSQIINELDECRKKIFVGVCSLNIDNSLAIRKSNFDTKKYFKTFYPKEYSLYVSFYNDFKKG
ncbi:MAG: hypothetical protein RLZZ175_2778 [Bacteroidota bacterium]|jgi:hypothetical protein